MKHLLPILLILICTSTFAQTNMENDTIPKSEIMVIEIAPEFPGGREKMVEFLQKNLKYPRKAREEEIEGVVVVKFVIKPDGSVADIEVQKGVDPLLDQEAVRVISLMPKWIPGERNATKVDVTYSMPVIFKL